MYEAGKKIEVGAPKMIPSYKYTTLDERVELLETKVDALIKAMEATSVYLELMMKLNIATSKN